MDTNDILRATKATQRLVQDDNYYKVIFKKTERIVSVVFYVMHNLKDTEEYGAHITDIEHSARRAHDAVLASLETRTHVAEDSVRTTAHALISLESKLRIAQVAGMIPPEVLNVLVNETDSVLRSMNHYLESDSPTVSFERNQERVPVRAASAKPARRQSSRATREQNTRHSDTPTLALTLEKETRQDQIESVLKNNPQATIKDISDVVNDVSEKTLQRDLNALIDKGVVKREGKRRWSTYSLV